MAYHKRKPGIPEKNETSAGSINKAAGNDSLPVNEQRGVTRRDILKIFRKYFGAIAFLAIFNEGCTETVDKTQSFTQNFNFNAHEPFDETDLKEVNERNGQKINAENCRAGFQKAMDEEISAKLNLSDFVAFADQNGIVSAESLLASIEGQKAVLDKYPFIKAINWVSSPAYPYNYELDSADGYIYVSLNDSSIAVNDYPANRSMNMIYNTSSPNVQTSPEYRDFQRTIYIGARDKKQGDYSREITFGPGMDMLQLKPSTVQSYSNEGGDNYNIFETQSFTRLLKDCKSTPIIDTFLKNILGQNTQLEQELGRPAEVGESFFSMMNIKSIDELVEIFRLLPPDPVVYGLLISRALRYHTYDKDPQDEYRDPVTALKSGWADCDDFAVINYFWAHLHNLKPNMLVIRNSRSDEHHVLVWYRDAKDRLVVMDNGDCLVLKPGEKIEEYLADFGNDYVDTRPGDQWLIDYNGPV